MITEPVQLRQSFSSRQNRTPSQKLAIHLTGQPRPFWGCFTGPLLMPSANYQQAVDKTRQRSAQLRAAEDRIRELEAHARHHQERAERAEQWLYQISVEIEQKFFGRAEDRLSQPPPPEALIRSQRR